jgi:excisionase family DNA binding protein
MPALTATEPPILLTTAQTARHLQLSVETARRLAREGHLPARRLYPGGRWRFVLDDIEALANGEREVVA